MDDREEIETLLSRIALRDAAALKALYRLVASRLMAVAWRVVQDRALAEDVLQEVFLTVWNQSAQRVAGQTLSLAWLCVVTRNRAIDGVRRRFFDYRARGVPFGPDDGTIAPWAAIASLPFAPEIVLPAIQHFNEQYPSMISEYGFKCSFNPTFAAARPGERGWISKGYYGLDQGPIVMMIENHRSGFFWELMKRCPAITAGLRRAGFAGGWL